MVPALTCWSVLCHGAVTLSHTHVQRRGFPAGLTVRGESGVEREHLTDPSNPAFSLSLRSAEGVSGASLVSSLKLSLGPTSPRPAAPPRCLSARIALTRSKALYGS